MDPKPAFLNGTTAEWNTDGSETPSESEKGRKQLTVTFRDIEIEVDGFGDGYASTCLSVVTDLLSFGKGTKSKRVRYSPRSYTVPQ
jgi:hypothetical protein